MSSRRLALAWTVTRVLMVVVLVHDVLWPHSRFIGIQIANDVRLDYWPATDAMFHGHVLYRDVPFEYPPGTVPFLAVAWLLGGGTRLGFVLAWIALMVALDRVVFDLLRRWQPERPTAAWVWVAGVTLLGPVTFVRNDLIVVAAFVAGAALLLRYRRPLGAGLALGFGVVAKLWPAIPLAIAFIARRGRVRLAAGAALAAAVVLLPFVALGAFDPLVTGLTGYHGHRPLEIESVWANGVWIAGLFGVHHPPTVYTFGSINLSSPFLDSVAVWADRLTYAVQAAALAVAGWLRWRARGELPARTVGWLWVGYLAASLVVTPVLSAQYGLWLLAAACATLAAGALGRRTTWLIAGVLAMQLLTQIIYPFVFNQLRDGALVPILLLTARTLALLAVLAAAALPRLFPERTVAGVRDAGADPVAPPREASEGARRLRLR